jgi:hypothetical protein
MILSSSTGAKTVWILQEITELKEWHHHCECGPYDGRAAVHRMAAVDDESRLSLYNGEIRARSGVFCIVSWSLFVLIIASSSLYEV